MNTIYEQRQKCGLTIEQLAEKSRVAPEDIARFKRDNYSIEQMTAYKAALIADALGCKIRELICE